ncbi:hypothetical protein GCM10022232_47740 [Streptomyces plumbiresistens]|uniref:Uncharacterized protein n=1 Tax=Streptomyces plumbiresistens TaxID=511811 RepID=A0ABP7RWN0_9ACTN
MAMDTRAEPVPEERRGTPVWSRALALSGTVPFAGSRAALPAWLDRHEPARVPSPAPTPAPRVVRHRSLPSWGPVPNHAGGVDPCRDGVDRGAAGSWSVGARAGRTTGSGWALTLREEDRRAVS